ncbi:MAG: efflux RND transporter permease subunit, partial [Planctomycetia bacterium]
MNPSAPFIARPVMTTLLTAALVFAGVLGYRALPVNDLPNVDFPTLSVFANLPGASPETMAAAVATPLERQFSEIAGLESLTSTSSLGATQITLQFALSRNIDAAAQDVQAAISKAARQLPPGMPAPPSYYKTNPADQPILFLVLKSDLLPLYQLDEYAQTLISPRLSMLAGVAQVTVFGSQKYAVRVQVDPTELAARSIGLEQVAQAVQQANVNMATGSFQGATQSFTVDSAGGLQRAADYRPIIVAYRNGSPVRLAELGRVVDGVENDKTASWLGDARSIILAVDHQPGANTVEVCQRVRDLLTTFRADLPPSVELLPMIDRSVSIQESIVDVQY